MDKQFRLFGKLSLVDLGLIGLVVVLVIFLIQFASPGSKEGDRKIRYTVEMASKELGFSKNIVIGEKLYDSVKGYEIGVIVDMYTAPEKKQVSDFHAGVIRETEMDGLECVYVVVETMASITTETTMVAGEYEVLVGKAVYIKSKDFASGGYVVIINRM